MDWGKVRPKPFLSLPKYFNWDDILHVSPCYATFLEKVCQKRDRYKNTVHIIFLSLPISYLCILRLLQPPALEKI